MIILICAHVMEMQIPGYTIIREINQGGMATVYLATQLSVGREVALKIMKPELDQDPEFHLRFKREAEIVGQLSHPNIVSIYDIGRFNGLNYISMNYLPNASLEQKIAAGMDVNSALLILKAIANALLHAHQKGYIHRDIKPDNILFRADNSAVLTDFGIARIADARVRMTQAGDVMGTPHYMSPEQARAKELDGRSDLYSLGIVFYEMLTGDKPFEGYDALTIALKHIQEPIPTLPRALLLYQSIINRLLAKNPDERFQSAQELLLSLQALTQTNTLNNKKTGMTSLLFVEALTNAVVGKSLALKKKAKQIFSSAQHESLLLATSSKDMTNNITRISVNHIDESALIINRSNNNKKYAWLVSLVVLAAVFFWFFSRTPNQAMSILTVDVVPASAKIRILNITERYVAGIQLNPGTYNVEVSNPGYEKFNNWIELKQGKQLVSYTLIKEHNDTASTKEKNIAIPEMVRIEMSNVLTSNQVVGAAAVQKNYSISKYEITFNQYDEFVAATSRSFPEDNGWGRDDRPVINVSWDDAQAYINWLSKSTGNQYKLPSEAEWEYAARGNTTSIYWWGNDEKDAFNRANCRFDCKSFISSLFGNKTAIVGSYPPNDFGVYDTAGNVAEWVENCAQDIANPTSETQLMETSPCSHRIVRGGSLVDNVKKITSSSRDILEHDTQNNSIGFRIVQVDNVKPREPVQPKKKNFFQRFFSVDR